MRLGSITNILAKRMLMYYGISEHVAETKDFEQQVSNNNLCGRAEHENEHT